MIEHACFVCLYTLGDFLEAASYSKAAFNLNASYYLEASSTATATATVMPTMGLLPILLLLRSLFHCNGNCHGHADHGVIANSHFSHQTEFNDHDVAIFPPLLTIGLYF